MSVGREEEKDYLKGRVGGAGRPWVGALYVHLRGGGWRWVGGGWADSARAWVVCDSHTNTGRSACSCLANTALYLFAAPNLDLLPLSNNDRWLSALLSFFFVFVLIVSFPHPEIFGPDYFAAATVILWLKLMTFKEGKRRHIRGFLRGEKRNVPTMY